MAVIRNHVATEFTGDDSSLQQTVVRSERTLDGYADAIDQVSRRTRGGASANATYDRSLQSLVNRYDPAKRAGQDFNRQLETLTTAFASGRITGDEYSRYLSGLRSDYANAMRGARGLDEAQDDLDDSTDDLSESTGRLSSGLGLMRSAIAAAGGAYAAWQALKIADEFQLLETRVALATEKTGDYEETMQRLYEMSQSNGTALKDTVDLYARISMSAEELGKSNKHVLDFTETVQQLGIVSGASQEEINSSLVQMSQSFAGGIVRAQELNTVIQSTPGIAKAAAKGLGGSVGDMRMRMLEGKLSAEDLFDAISSQSAEAARQFETMPLSITSSMTMFGNSAGNILDALNDVSGATGSVSSSIQGVSLLMDDFTGWMRSGADSTDAVSESLFDVADAAPYAGAAIGAMFGPIGVAVGGLAGLIVKLAEARAEIEKINKTKIQLTDAEDAAELRVLLTTIDQVESSMALMRKSGTKNSDNYKAQSARLAELTGKVDVLRQKRVQANTVTEKTASVEEQMAAFYAESRQSLDKMFPSLDKKNKIEELRQKLTARAAAGEKQAIELLGELDEATKKNTKSRTKNTKKITEAEKAQRLEEKSLQSLLDKYDPMRKAQRDYNDDIELLERSLSSLQITQEQYDLALTGVETSFRDASNEASGLTDELKKQKEAAEALDTGYRSIVDELFPLDVLTREYNEDVDVLTRMMGLNGDATGRLAEAMGLLGERYDESRDKLTGVTEANEEAAKRSEEAWGSFNTATASIFDDFLDGSIRDLDDFGDTVGDMFLDMGKNALSGWLSSGITELFQNGGTGSSGGLDLAGLVSGSQSGGGFDLASVFGGQSGGGFDLSSVLGGAEGAGLGAMVSQIGGAVSAASPYVAAALIGYELSQAAEDKWGQSTAALLSPISLWENLLFEGGKGTFSTGDWETRWSNQVVEMIDGQVTAYTESREKKDGGWFHGDRWRMIEEESAFSVSALSGAFAEMSDFAVSFGDLVAKYSSDSIIPTIGGGTLSAVSSADLMAGFDASFQLDTSGMDADEVSAALDEWMAETQADMLALVAAPFRRAFDNAGDSSEDLIEPITSAVNDMALFEAAGLQLSESFGFALERTDALAQHFLDFQGMEITATNAYEIEQQINEHVNRSAVEFLSAIVPEFAGVLSANETSLAEILQPLMDVGTYLSADFAPELQLSFSDAITGINQTLLTSVTNYDSSVVSTQAMAEQANQALLATQEFVGYVRSMRDGLAQSSTSLRDMIWRDTHSTGELYAKLITDVEALQVALGSAVDPERIAEIRKEMDGKITEAWNILPTVMKEQGTELENDVASINASLSQLRAAAATATSDKKAEIEAQIATAEAQLKALATVRDKKLDDISQEFLDFVDEVEETTNDALTAAEEWAVNEHTRIADIIENRFSTIGTDLSSAATDQSQAAANLSQAAISLAQSAGMLSGAANAQNKLPSWVATNAYDNEGY